MWLVLKPRRVCNKGKSLNNKKVINREASDKTKGFRLQKLRAIKFILDELENSESLFFYTAIENVEDLSHTNIDQCESKQDSTYYEEDKNYAEKTNFTIFNHEVKNTLVSFFDIYVGSWNLSDDVLLGFYTTASIGKEKKKFTLRGKEKLPPETPILATLSSNEEISDDLVEMIKSVVVEEYKSQYSAEDKKGHIETLEELDVERFRKFLVRIKWYFGEENEDALRVTILEKIKYSRLYNIRHQNKEEAIFSILMEELDKRQNYKKLTQKVLTVDTVKLVFNRAESEEGDLVMDPVWQDLKQMEAKITDKRNLEEKITSVCPSYAKKKIQYLARLACRAKTEQLSSNKSFLSLKYRAYEACSEYFFNNNIQPSTEGQIDEIIKSLQSTSNNHVQELKKDYSYSVSNQVTVNGVVIDLFDSCFLSFDEVNDDG